MVLGLYLNGRLNGWLSGRLIGGDAFREESICRGEYLWEECDYNAFEDVFGYKMCVGMNCMCVIV